MKQAGQVNTAVRPPSKTVKEIVYSNTFTYFNFVFLIIAIILIAVRSYRDLTFLGAIIANALIGIYQEIHAKAQLDKLTMLNAPTARVIRDGHEIEINAEKLVLNDIVVFRAGNQIPADAVVVHGEVSVNESLLTGEADEIHKAENDELMSGSFIVSGECYAQLIKVGAESYISQLTLQAKKVKTKEQSEIIRSLNKIVQIAGIAIIPVGAIIFIQNFFLNNVDIQRSVQSAVAAVIGMIPEGLFVLSSIALAVSTIKLAQKKVLLHDMKSIETLARVNVLCVDKTGTITSPEMGVDSFVPLEKNARKEELRTLLSDFMDAQAPDNATMIALKEYFVTPGERIVDSVTGFSSEFKYSGVNFKENESYVLGAPEFLLGKDFEKYREQIEEYNHKGYRVLLFAKYDGTADGKKLSGKLTPKALVLMTNPIRDSAIETFKFFDAQGVEIKVISGDNPITVAEVSRKAGIKNADKFVDASTLTNDVMIAEAMKKYTVFGRVTPDQKRKFVKALQASGHTVAMTGDGVNDVLALRDADCSVAMASGSDAAVQAAQVVLLESDFSRMPEVVAEGRRVVNNLERSGSLFLVKNVFSFITAMLAICFALAYPLVPAQISLVSIFTIGIPGFLLSQAPNHDLIKGRFISNILKRAVPGGLTDMVVVMLMVIVGRMFHISTVEVSTCCTFLIAFVGMIMVWRASKPLDWYKRGSIAICVLGMVLAYIIMPNFFGMSRMGVQAWILLYALAIVAIPVLQIMTIFTEWVWTKMAKIDFMALERWIRKRFGKIADWIDSK